MAESPSLNAEGAVEVEILCAGAAIPDSYEVMSVRTFAETNRIPEATIILADGDPATSEFPATDSTNFKPGTEITVKAGYGADTTEEIFAGVVTAVRLRVNMGESRLEVTCRDKFFKATMGRKSAFFEKQKDSDILSTLAGNHGVSVTAEATTETWPELVQSRVTDWDFMLMRAEANGQVINITDGKADVKKPALDTPVLEITYGEDLYGIDIQTDIRAQYSNFKAESWDPKTVAPLSGAGTNTSASAPGDLTTTVLSGVTSADFSTLTSAPVPQSFLTTMMKARASRADVGRMNGEVRFLGSSKAKLGTTIELKNLADRFNGKGYVSAVLHQIEGGAWMTVAGIGIAANWHSDQPEHIEMPGASGIAAPMRSLQLGTVKKLSEDPDGLHRIQVSMPLVTGTEKEALVWARYGTPYASKGIGFQMLPEIGDEVVIGFLDDNPSYPIILGSLHNGKNARPEPPADENNYIKMFLSREKMMVKFDEEKKIITIETPAKNTVILDDDAKSVTIEDQNGNKGVFDSSGILLDSPKEITIKAGSNITIQAGGNIDAKATGNFTAQGVNVECNASASFKGAGGAQAELSGPLAKVSGSLVKIN